VTAASARIVAAVSAETSSKAQPHSVCGDEQRCAATAVTKLHAFLFIEKPLKYAKHKNYILIQITQ